MRELIRSILRFSWGTSLFWVRQAANGLAPSRASGDLRAVADAASGELSGALGGLYQQGAALQSRMIDAVVPTNGPASAGTSPPAASSPVPAQAPERRRNVDTGRL